VRELPGYTDNALDRYAGDSGEELLPAGTADVLLFVKGPTPAAAAAVTAAFLGAMGPAAAAAATTYGH
jgi:hypothetical protein